MSADDLARRVKALGPIDGRHVLVIDSDEVMEPEQMMVSLGMVLAHFHTLGTTAPMVMVGPIDRIRTLDELEMSAYGWRRFRARRGQRRWLLVDGWLLLTLGSLAGPAVDTWGGVEVPLWQRCVISAPWAGVWLRARWGTRR